MNRKQIIAAAALALLGASSAFAGGEFDPLTGFPEAGHSTTTRAQVLADVAAARAAGTLNVDRDNRLFADNAVQSGLTRAEVRAELARARADGSIVDFDTGLQYAQAPKASSTLTREQVREEARLALRAKAARANSGS